MRLDLERIEGCRLLDDLAREHAADAMWRHRPNRYLLRMKTFGLSVERAKRLTVPVMTSKACYEATYLCTYVPTYLKVRYDLPYLIKRAKCQALGGKVPRIPVLRLGIPFAVGSGSPLRSMSIMSLEYRSNLAPKRAGMA